MTMLQRYGAGPDQIDAMLTDDLREQLQLDAPPPMRPLDGRMVLHQGRSLRRRQRIATTTPLAAAGAPSQSGQVRLHGGFVNEHQPFGLATHKGNAPLLPLVPGLFYTGAVLFGGHQRFFL